MNPGAAQEIQFVAEGLHPAWALILFLGVSAAIFWAYRWSAPNLSLPRRRWLATLRALSALLLIMLLVQPALLLTTYETVRERLLVLFDDSQSMRLVDQRVEEADRVRLGIARGVADPRRGLNQNVADVGPPAPRSDLVAALALNERMNFWSRLGDVVDLSFYRFARELSPLPTKSGADKEADPAATLTFNGTVSAIGDALDAVLLREGANPLAGVLLISDGASNTGRSLADAGASLADAGVPVFAYGVGIEAPRDLILAAVDGPRVSFAGERAEFTARLRSSNLEGQRFQLELLAEGQVVAQESVTIAADGELTATVGFVPDTAGRQEITLRATGIDGEADLSNNEASTPLRVIGDRVRVLYLEGQPRWDFRYLLATLERDRRLDVQAYLFESDASMRGNPVYLSELPTQREEWFDYQIIILGDVEPDRLGQERMEWIREWVDKIGGGLILLAGPRANPLAFARTPLEVILPVTLLPNLSAERARARYPEPRALRLTPAGELSPDFAASEAPEENRRIWQQFPGVRWTATVGPAKPGALVVAVDTERSKVNQQGAMPVIAMQNFGLGVVVYFGFEETYRWRSRVGEKHYLGVWGRLIQSLSLRRLEGASSLVQLRATRPRLALGESLTIEGTLYQPNYQPLKEPSVGATMEKPDGGTESVVLTALAGRPGEYRLDYRPTVPGVHRFFTERDPSAGLEFEAIEPRLELIETAMAADALRALVNQTGGLFLREENLHTFPEALAERSATVPRHTTWKLYLSPWWLVALLLLLSVEWALRRIWQLK